MKLSRSGPTRCATCLAAGVGNEALEVNAYGKSQSAAGRQRRLCTGAARPADAAEEAGAAVAQVGKNE